MHFSSRHTGLFNIITLWFWILYKSSRKTSDTWSLRLWWDSMQDGWSWCVIWSFTDRKLLPAKECVKKLSTFIWGKSSWLSVIMNLLSVFVKRKSLLRRNKRIWLCFCWSTTFAFDVTLVSWWSSLMHYLKFLWIGYEDNEWRWHKFVCHIAHRKHLSYHEALRRLKDVFLSSILI